MKQNVSTHSRLERGQRPDTKELADYLSCSQVCYSNYETGKRDVPSDVLIRLARFYHTSVDYLVGLTEERAPYPKKK